MIRCYSHRMLNPFHGTVNLVEIEGADAVTRDGVHWSLYIQGGVDRELDDQGNAFEVELPDIKFGTWSAAAGLRRSPVRSVVDYQWLDALGSQLLEAVKRRADRLPFPLEDRYELWLLDGQSGLPLALLDSRCEAPAGPSDPAPEWRPGNRAREGFRMPDRSGQHPSEELAQLVHRAAGPKPRAQWFCRDEQGGGEGMEGAGQSARRLAVSAFPELLLRESWASAKDARLVRAFLDWQAPWLLSLQRLGRDSRRALERVGCLQALRLAGLYRLYPQIEDRHRVRAALVEAELRRAFGVEEGATLAAEPDFFVSGN